MFGCLRADHADNAVPLDHLAARTHLPDRRTNLHLRISLIRPRDRSVSASSTPTLSPARSRVKWVPARSATWARTFAPFSSSTLYTPLGRGSTTTPFTSEGRWGTNGDCTKEPESASLSPSPRPSPRSREGVKCPFGEHDRPLFCDSDGVLKVGGQRSVGGADRPAVGLHVDLVGAGVDHGLDRQRHAGLETRRGAGDAEVGDLGVLVHLAADPVADELADD